MDCDTFGTSVLGYFKNAGAVDDVALAPAQHSCPTCYNAECDTIDDDDDDGTRGYGRARSARFTEREDGMSIKAVVDGMTDEEVHAKFLSLLQTASITARH